MTPLYGDTTMPVSEIARKFGIGESSVYHLAQRHGAARTRPGAHAATSAAKPPETWSTAAVAGARARERPRGASAWEAAPTAALAQQEFGPSGARARLRLRGATLGRFRVRFLTERVVQARDIRDALRKAEAFKAIEVTAVMHEE